MDYYNGQHVVNKSDYLYSESVFKCSAKMQKIRL